MKLLRPFSFLLVLGSLLLMAGCQSTPETEPVEQKQILSTPSSVGPTELPSVVGPSTPPPGHEIPQAVTEVEKVQFTLPGVNEAEFKN